MGKNNGGHKVRPRKKTIARGKGHFLDSAGAVKLFARLTVWYPRRLRKQSPVYARAKKKNAKNHWISWHCPFKGCSRGSTATSMDTSRKTLASVSRRSLRLSVWKPPSLQIIYHINSLILCVCLTAVFRCFHIEKSPSRPVSFAQWFSWGGGFLLRLISRLNSLWKCPNEHFGLPFRTPHTQEIDDLTLPGRPSTLIGCRPRIDAVLSPVFGKWPPKHAFDERSKNSVVLHANAQFRALEKPPFWPSFSTRALVVERVSFVWRAASSGGLRDDTAAGNVASLTFTRKCLLHGASDCGCGNGFLFSRRPRPVSQSLQSALAWFQSALAWFRLLRASDCRCGNGFLWPRPVSQSLQSALSWFQSALACFVCSVLRFADAGMVFSLAKDRDLSRCGIKCPSHWSHAVGHVRSFYQTL